MHVITANKQPRRYCGRGERRMENENTTRKPQPLSMPPPGMQKPPGADRPLGDFTLRLTGCRPTIARRDYLVKSNPVTRRDS